jgi:FkbH-like protein
MLIEFVGNVITQPFGQIVSQFRQEGIDVSHGGIDQVIPTLLSKSKADVLIVHLTPDYFLSNRGHGAVPFQIMQQFSDAAVSFVRQNRTVLVINTLYPPVRRTVGTNHLQRLRTLSKLNESLFACADANSWISIADVSGVLARLGHDQALNLANDALMKMPYSQKAVLEIVKEYKLIISERFQVRKKVILLDADNTLWGGVVGEDGYLGIKIDDQFPGLLYWRFQEALKELQSSGLLLALVTKNNEPDVREAFEKRAMPLSWKDFVTVRSNWDPKSSNVGDIAQELNLGIDSMIFIDDNPIEIAEVRVRYPELTLRQFDVRQVADVQKWLEDIPGLCIWSPTAEDLAKAEQYRQESERREVALSAASIDDYISSLDIVIEAGTNRKPHVKRISQLTNKTNQFNLTTRRYTEAEILEVMDEGMVFDFRVRDKFGDMGIIGVAVVQDKKLDAFLVSCRALGRHVESDMLKYVISRCGLEQFHATYVATTKNALVANFFSDEGFDLTTDDGTVRHYSYNSEREPKFRHRIVEVE